MKPYLKVQVEEPNYIPQVRWWIRGLKSNPPDINMF